MKKTNIITLIALVIILLQSCKPEFDNYESSKGDADFTSYVALGNSITSGFSNGALYKSGQEVAYPNLLAQQFKLVGGGNFKTPFMIDEFGLGGRRELGYVTDCSGATSLSPKLAVGTVNPANMQSVAAQGPYNNMGVPGSKSFHLLYPGYAVLNPYFGRFASSTTTTILQDAMLSNPSFFTLWIGNNDVLTYALAGGATDSVTPTVLFNGYMQQIVSTLKGTNNRKGAIANIPDILSIPFFTTVPSKAIPLSSPTDVAALNTAYTQLNQALKQIGQDTVKFALGANAPIIEDPSLPLPPQAKMRQLKNGEIIILSIPQDSMKCAGWGTMKPIPHRYILDLNEINKIRTAIQSYNQTIENLANQNNLALVDVAGYMNQAVTGIYFDGMKFTTKFVTGGIFSLDGVHLTPQGNAIVTNYFLEAINKKYNAHIPYVNISDYKPVLLP